MLWNEEVDNVASQYLHFQLLNNLNDMQWLNLKKSTAIVDASISTKIGKTVTSNTTFCPKGKINKNK